MSNNSILDELHATRQKLLADVGGDLHRYVSESRERALASGRAIAEPTQRLIRSTGEANIVALTLENQSSPPSEHR